MNLDQKDNLQKQIDERLERSIEPSTSQGASPIVSVKKQDRRTRWVTDLREMNMQTVKDSNPLTSLEGATVFLSLDTC